MPERQGRRLGPVAHAELAVDVGDVAVDRGDGDDQLGGDLLGRPAPGQRRSTSTSAGVRPAIGPPAGRLRPGARGGVARRDLRRPAPRPGSPPGTSPGPPPRPPRRPAPPSARRARSSPSVRSASARGIRGMLYDSLRARGGGAQAHGPPGLPQRGRDVGEAGQGHRQAPRTVHLLDQRQALLKAVAGLDRARPPARRRSPGGAGGYATPSWYPSSRRRARLRV